MRVLAEKVTIDRGGRRLFANISFGLEGGEALAVTGRNGAGKSTLLRALAGLIPTSGGRIVYAEGPSPLEEAAQKIHYLGHADALKTALTAGENLAFWGAMLAGDGEARLAPRAALTRLGLGHVENLPVRYLSAGQKRRVALARLLVARRSLWLLDEPTTALDAESRQRFAEILGRHLAEGGLAIAATHVDLGLASLRELELGSGA